jgi:D-alanyl-lipoteichoic acid acyltransferase DltB (MBOAT superfamily)
MSRELLPTFVRRSRFASERPATARGVELIVYSCLGLWITWAMVNCTWELSSTLTPGLSPGYLFGNRPMDNSDAQYRGFRSNIPALIPLALGHVFMSQFIVSMTNSSEGTSRAIPVKIYISLLLSCIVFFVFYGFDVLKVLFFNFCFFFATKATQNLFFAPVLYWSLSIATLLMINWVDLSDMPLFEFFNTYKGMGLNWTASYNFNILRMISYGMDNYWRCQNPKMLISDHEKHCKECQESRFNDSECAKLRIEAPLPDSNYNLVNFMAYTLYLPLYLAGPIITFNDFIAQSKKKPKSITLYGTLVYGARWILLACLMEIMIHAFHVIAISKARAWDGFTPFQITMVGFWSLKHIWLKLTVIWKFFRLWVHLRNLIFRD